MIKIAFKFTFLGIEFSRDKEQNIKGMEKRKMSIHKLTKQQKKFKHAVKICHKTKTIEAFSRCMHKKLRR